MSRQACTVRRLCLTISSISSTCLTYSFSTRFRNSQRLRLNTAPCPVLFNSHCTFIFNEVVFISNGDSLTNNHAEGKIRPAVIRRKLMQGNRSDCGVWTHAGMMSIIHVLQRRGYMLIDTRVK